MLSCQPDQGRPSARVPVTRLAGGGGNNRGVSDGRFSCVFAGGW